ncbi:clusterin isoform X1 [Podarcis raffonei]|uniref:clusterin isoform X1 n=2 Tax=Podarcis raffonei TaxID=65483 RepID=UPI002329187A|nr:clusterin isoform X1 [Podarcis raffonei]
MRHGSTGRGGRARATREEPGFVSAEKMTPSGWLPLLGLLFFWDGGHCLVPPEELKQMSETGSKLVDSELENAINGVRQMKVLMDQTSRDHRDILNALEDTKKQKEEALLLAQETEKQLSEKEVCNETMLALWEECKPCLKQTCMRFYTRTCHSGAGLVGRQLEDFLNHSSPFTIWVNGERIDSLKDADENQGQRLDDLEERYSLVEGGVDDLFQESTQAYGHLAPFFQSPFSGFRDMFWGPIRSIRLPGSRLARDVSAFPSFPGQYRPHQDFHQLFQSLHQMTQQLMDGVQKGPYGQWPEGRPGLSLGRFPTGSPSPADDRLVCREIRRNSAGCLRMKERCEKCQAILDVDCSQTDPEQTLLRERFEDALRLAERFTRRYDEILKAFQEEMLNTTSLLDQLNQQFGWVSRLANVTRNSDKLLQVTMVATKTSDPEDPAKPSDTQVTVQLFDSEPLTLLVPGDLEVKDPRFMDLVTKQAIRQFKANEVE